MATSSSAEIDPALLEGLGRVVYQWAFVEAVEGMMLAFLVQANWELSQVVTARVSGSTMTGWIRTLVPVRFTDPTTQDRILDLLTRIDEARAERNAFVHGMWTPGNVPHTAFVTSIRWDRREVMVNRVVGADDLHSLAETIGEIYEELVWLGRQAGFYTMPAPPTQNP
jgi:hypothetical protein